MNDENKSEVSETEEVSNFRSVRPDLVELVGCMLHSNLGNISDKEATAIFNQILKERSYQDIVDLNILFAAWTAKLVEDIAALAHLSPEETFRLICANQINRPE